MTLKSALLAFMFLAGACGGSDKEPTTPSTTKAEAPDEKSEENIQMSAGNPAPAAKPPAASEPAKPAAASEPAKPATASEPAKPAGQPK